MDDTILPILLILAMLSPVPPQWQIDQVESWRPLVTKLWEEREYHWEGFTVDLILAVMGQESMGNRYAIADDQWNSAGLMQVGAQPWMGVTQEQLLNPTLNIQWGIWFLERALSFAGGDIRTALQIYNCGPDGVRANIDCGDRYAERVLKYWLPVFGANMQRSEYGRSNSNGPHVVGKYRGHCRRAKRHGNPRHHCLGLLQGNYRSPGSGGRNHEPF